MDPDELAGLMKRAKGLLAVGDIASARLLLERAADAQEAKRGADAGADLRPEVLGNQDMRIITPIRRWPRPGTRRPRSSAPPTPQRRSPQNSELIQDTRNQQGTSCDVFLDGTRCHDDGVRPCGARAEETEYDPAKVSDSLKAIFQFGSARPSRR